MIHEDQTWQQREITGTTTHYCENCGRPVSESLLRQAADETTDDGGVGMRICPDCLNAIGRGTAPVELDDENDLEPAR